MGLRSSVRSRALGVAQRALERLLADEGRAQKVAEAVGAVQGAKAQVDATQRAVLHQLSVSTRSDFQSLGQQVSALKRRLVRLGLRLERRQPGG